MEVAEEAYLSFICQILPVENYAKSVENLWKNTPFFVDKSVEKYHEVCEIRTLPDPC